MKTDICDGSKQMGYAMVLPSKEHTILTVLVRIINTDFKYNIVFIRAQLINIKFSWTTKQLYYTTQAVRIDTVTGLTTCLKCADHVTEVIYLAKTCSTFTFYSYR